MTPKKFDLEKKEVKLQILQLNSLLSSEKKSKIESIDNLHPITWSCEKRKILSILINFSSLLLVLQHFVQIELENQANRDKKTPGEIFFMLLWFFDKAGSFNRVSVVTFLMRSNTICVEFKISSLFYLNSAAKKKNAIFIHQYSRRIEDIINWVVWFFLLLLLTKLCCVMCNYFSIKKFTLSPTKPSTVFLRAQCFRNKKKCIMWWSV